MKTKLFSMLVLVALTMTACGGTAPVADDQNTDAPVVAEPVVVVPEGCPQKTDLTVSSKEVSGFKAVKSYYTTWGTRLDTPDIFFSNYEDIDPANKYGHDIVGKEALVVIRPSRLDKTEMTVGTYTKVEGDNNKLGEVNISTEKLAGGVFDKEATVEITYMDDQYVCGSVKADDSYSKVVGDFIATRHVN